jgi:hypothetical protein
MFDYFEALVMQVRCPFCSITEGRGIALSDAMAKAECLAPSLVTGIQAFAGGAG